MAGVFGTVADGTSISHDGYVTELRNIAAGQRTTKGVLNHFGRLIGKSAEQIDLDYASARRYSELLEERKKRGENLSVEEMREVHHCAEVIMVSRSAVAIDFGVAGGNVGPT